MDRLLQDLRYAVRSLAHRPGFVAVAVVTLGLGIGANSAVFSVVNAVLLRPLPYDDPERLTVLWTDFGPDLPQNWISGPEFVEMQEFATAFEGVAVASQATTSLIGTGQPEQIQAGLASGGLFRLLRAEPALGRLIGPDDDTPSASSVAVLDHGFWRRRFGGDPAVIGQTMTTSGNTYTVVGVLPEGFRVMHPDPQFPQVVDVWLPLVPVSGTTYAEMNRGNHGLRGFGRMQAGVTIEQARADMDRVASRITEIAPDNYPDAGLGIIVLPLHGDLVEEVRPALLILLGAVAFVLLIACVNVANLQLVRAAGREREIAVRAALGAGRGRILRQLATESGVLAAAGVAFGLLVAFGLVQALVALAPEGLPRRDAIGVDLAVLLFTLGIGLVTGLLFGLAPAFHTLKLSLVGSLKEGGRGGGMGVRGRRTRTGLVVAEMALALVLLVGAGLMIQSLRNLLNTDPGYRTEGLLTVRVALPSSRYDDQAASAFWDRILERTRALPGVTSAGMISHLPLSRSYWSGTTTVDRSDAVETDPRFPFPNIEADRRMVSTGYFETMGVDVVSGRAFTESDADGAPLVAMVDEEFARRFWPDEPAVGRRIAVSFGDDGPVWRDVVGVVRHSRHYGLESVGREQVYMPYPQFTPNTAYLTVRTAGDPEALIPTVRGEVWALDPEQPISDVRTMRERVASAVAAPRFDLLLLGTFAAIALVLAAVGIYGVISYSVGQRTHEIGVRMALGASRDAVRTLVLKQGMFVALGGVAIGLVAALGLTRLLGTLLYGVSPTDPITYAVVAAILSGIAALACLVPAMRATRVEPVSVLREE